MNVEKIFEKLDLYFHNKGISLKVKEAYERGEDVVSIIQATGTGKTLIALFVAMLYPDKDTLYVVPSNAIKEHVYEVIDDLGLDLEKDFPKLNIVTYQSFIRMSRKEIENIPCELLICDEIHHLGAPVWKDRMETLKETHEGMKVLGMSAYTVRRRGTAYEMDVTDAYTNELFSGSVVSVYDIYDAIIDGVLPKFNYKTTVVEDMEEIVELEKELERIIDKNSDYYKECERLVLDFKKMIHKSDGVKELIKKTIDMGDKCIYFCPVNSSLGNNDIDSIMEEVKETLKEIYNEEDIVFYKTTSEDGDKGKYNRECFYNDVDLNGKDSSNKIRIMFAKNQYNEGVHAPGVNKVLLGRMTRSDIVYFEQIGRCLAACRDIRKLMSKYEGYTLEELQREVKRKELDVSDYNDRDVLIEVLVAPMVVDLSGNILFIEEMENNLKTRVEEVKESNKTGKKRNINIKNVSFNIDIVNKEMMNILFDLRERLVDSNWNNYYELAKKYYEHYGDSEIKSNFKTKNGIDYDDSLGCINLGRWIAHQRGGYDKLSEERKSKLDLIEFRIESNKRDLDWEKNYELAKKYYERFGDSEIIQSFKTKNGIDYDDSLGCINLGRWIENQRVGYDKLSDERREKLALIKFRTERNKRDLDWENNYELAKKYYERFGDSEIVQSFKTKNGYEYDNSQGCINLGKWINTQRVGYDKLSKDKKIKLELIKFRIESNKFDLEWEKNYELAKKYYEHYGNSDITFKFKTKNGYEYDDSQGCINLGRWIENQRVRYDKLSEGKKRKLALIEFRIECNKYDLDWEKNYELAKKYYEHYRNSEIKYEFKTKNGIDYDDSYGCVNLGNWIKTQRVRCDKLNEDKKRKLELIEFRIERNKRDLDWENNYELAKKYYEHYGNSDITFKFKTKNGIDYDDSYGCVNLGGWISTQRMKYDTLSEERKRKLALIGFRIESNKYDLNWEKNYELAKKYYEHYGNSDITFKFKTKNGYEYDNSQGCINLGRWIENQRKVYDKISEDKKNKLDLIEFKVSIRKHKNIMIELCEEYGIDYKKHEFLVKNMSYQELVSKINYLNDNGFSLIVDGEINPLFKMSSENMMELIGLNKQELIKEYYINKKGKVKEWKK